MSPLGRRRSGGVYVPPAGREPVDWAAVQQVSDAQTAEIARVEAGARKAQEAFHRQSDPLAQLVERCHAIELRHDVTDKRLGVLGEQLQVIIEQLKERER